MKLLDQEAALNSAARKRWTSQGARKAGISKVFTDECGISVATLALPNSSTWIYRNVDLLTGTSKDDRRMPDYQSAVRH